MFFMIVPYSRVQVPPEDGLRGESTSREWSLGPKDILRMVLDP